MKILEFPGFWDVHVHFRDPGQPAAETRASGAAAAAAGGFTRVTTMPNTTPAGDSARWIREQIEDALLPVSIAPAACISKGRLGREVADLEALAAAGAVAFTDDGAFVSSARVMEEAMRRAAKLKIPVMQHAVVPEILGRGVVRDCRVARACGLPAMPPEAETEAVKRDIALVRETGCALHVQHVSCAGTVEIVRAAQREGLPVTAEATPHHLLFSCEDVPADDANWKMAPPLGNPDDVAALREAVKDGTFALFATDHAPHAAAAKAGGFLGSANGIVGLETAVPVTWHVMVEQEGMDPAEWAKRWTEGPSRLLGLPCLGRTRVDVEACRKVDPERFLSKSRNMPYADLAFAAWPCDVPPPLSSRSPR